MLILDRATGSMNEMAYVVQAWLPLLVWKQTDAPEYRKGYVTVTCLAVLMMATAMLTRWLHNGEAALRQSESVSDLAEEVVVGNVKA